VKDDTKFLIKTMQVSAIKFSPYEKKDYYCFIDRKLRNQNA